jgi:hypothetical protein
MKSERFSERAPSIHAFPRNEFHFSQLHFPPAERAPRGEWLIPEPPSPDRERARNRAGVDSYDVPLSPAKGYPIRAGNWE